jgi:hypothetical protein
MSALHPVLFLLVSDFPNPCTKSDFPMTEPTGRRPADGGWATT